MPKAMILAAGLGTRLIPLTRNSPKALIPVAGKPLIEHVIDRFRQFNINDVVVNLHHCGDQLQNFLAGDQFGDMNISFSDERIRLLDTGGGIRQAAWFFCDGRPFLIHNCDVISLLPLDEMLRYHIRRKAIATMAVSQRPTSRPLAFSKDGKLLGRAGKTGSSGNCDMAFSGIYILDPAVFSYMPDAEVFSIVDVLIKIAPEASVVAYEHDPDIWVDAGRIKNFEKAEQLLKNAHL
jgi:NDP-sugar pyrophosphorylase family protein